MKASFFEPVQYVTPQKMPSEWPLPAGFYDPDLGAQAFRMAFTLAQALGVRPLQAHCHHSLGTLYAKIGQRE